MTTENSWEQRLMRVCKANSLSVSQIDNLFFFAREEIEAAEQRGEEQFARKVEEAIRDTQSIEDLSARLLAVITHSLARSLPDQHEGV